jgi:pimeloyl-ACP methyl ester carboxylesterase
MGGGSIGGALALVAAGEGAAIDAVVLLDVPTVPVREAATAEVARMARARETGRAALQRVDAAFLTSGFVDDVFRDADRWRRAAVRLEVPTLLIAGKRGAIGAEHPRLYREHIPHGEFVAVDGGHLVARDAPLETACALERFLLDHFGLQGQRGTLDEPL